ncbi:hypothetical protein GGR56DRAFT_660938 [Xylariaceae sp. FL0804]|nr:hypothetical protein GGR56DRAFT_660938 [Xylariaceae sp. FL0804]
MASIRGARVCRAALAIPRPLRRQPTASISQTASVRAMPSRRSLTKWAVDRGRKRPEVIATFESAIRMAGNAADTIEANRGHARLEPHLRLLLGGHDGFEADLQTALGRLRNLAAFSPTASPHLPSSPKWIANARDQDFEVYFSPAWPKLGSALILNRRNADPISYFGNDKVITSCPAWIRYKHTPDLEPESTHVILHELTRIQPAGEPRVIDYPDSYGWKNVVRLKDPRNADNLTYLARVAEAFRTGKCERPWIGCEANPAACLCGRRPPTDGKFVATAETENGSPGV